MAYHLEINMHKKSYKMAYHPKKEKIQFLRYKIFTDASTQTKLQILM
jgi:hypothetical protein